MKAQKSLFMSVVSLLLCVSMLVGSTFAWFTDSVSSGSNVITSGNLDLEVQYTLDGENWKDLNGAKDLFQKGLWEPGHTEVVALKVSNVGSLALKYVASMKIFQEAVGKTKDGKDIVLSDILTVSTLTQQANAFGDIALMLAYMGENKVGYETTSSFKAANVLGQEKELLPGDAHYVFIKVDMAETVGNEANHDGVHIPTIDFGINVLASQFAYENDSFGNQYDAGATFDDLANTSILATETKTLVAGADSVKFNLVNNGMTIANVTVPASAIADTTKPVTVTFDGINPSQAAIVDENTQAYAYDIDVTNLKDNLSGDQLITVVVTAPNALAAMKAYHNGVLIQDAVYDEVEGTITFKTANFSPFAFTANVTPVYNLEELRTVLNTNEANAKLMADLEIDLREGKDRSEAHKALSTNGKNTWYNGVNIKGLGVGLDLNGHKITVKCYDADNYNGHSNQDVGALFFVDKEGSLNINDTVGGGFIKMASSIYAVWAPYDDPSYMDIYGGVFIADSYAGDPIGTPPPADDNPMDDEMKYENSNRALIYAGTGGKMNIYGGYFLYNSTPNDFLNRNNGAFNCTNGYEGNHPFITIHDGVMLIDKEYRQDPTHTSEFQNILNKRPDAKPTDPGIMDNSSIKLDKYCEVFEIRESVKIDGTTYDTWYRVSIKQPSSITADGSQMLYVVGDTLNLTVKVNYAFGSKTLEAGDYTLSAYDMSFGGKKNITITYTENEKTVSTDILIDVKDEFSSIIASPKKQTYNIGDTVSKSDFTVSAVAADGTSGSVANYTISNVDTSTTGVKKVTVSYTNNQTGKVISTTCEINVLNLKKVTGNQVPTVKYWHAGNFAASNNWNHAEVPGTGYESYVGKTYTGANGEISSGFNLTGHTAAQPMSGYNNLTVTNAKPYSLMGINGTIGFENATVKSMGYYVDGDLSTIKNNATLVDAGNGNTAYIAQANLYDFAPGSTHTITYVVETEAGFIDLCQWTVTMAAASNDAFVDTDKPNVNVIIIAGQSNACGASPITQSLKNQYSNVNYKNVYMQYKNTYVNGDGTIGTACESAAFEKYYFGMGGFQSQHFGPEAGLAYYLATNEATKNEQWFIIKYAATGTTITQWVNGVMLADELIDFVEGAIEPLTADYDVQIRSLLWMQGETDACEAMWASAYKANEQKLVTHIRNAFAGYATRTNAAVAGSGISFISAGIAPNSLVGQETNGLVGNEVANGGRNDWEHSATVNWAKFENAEHWYLPNVTGGGSVFGGGIPAGWYYTNQSAPGIINSAYIDTYTLISKNEAPDSEKAEYVVATDPTDWAHYSSASMIELGEWFGEALVYVAGKESTTNNSSATTSKTYTVTYNGNGGTVSPNKVVVAEGKAITLLPAAREGYTFKGWSDGANTYAAGAEYTVTGNVTLTAQWEEAKYTITVQNNNGNVTYSVDKLEAKAGETITITLTRSGYSTRATTYTVTCNGESKTVRVASGRNKSASTTFTMPAGDVTITIS